jgi:hypothetical protein
VPRASSRGLRDAELGLDDAAEFARRRFAVGEQFEDAASHGIAEDVECVHDFIFARRLI